MSPTEEALKSLALWFDQEANRHWAARKPSEAFAAHCKGQGVLAAIEYLPDQLAEYERKVAACPTPIYHETHHYCPACPWNDEHAIAGSL